MIVLGKDLICFKEDAVIKVTWVGGQVRFTQQRFPFDGGIAGALAAWKISDAAIIFLSTDGVLYIVTASGIADLSGEFLTDTIPPTIPRNNLRTARAVVNKEEEMFYLFFNRDNVTQPYLDSYICYNYREKAWGTGNLGINVVAVANHQINPQAQEKLLVTTSDHYVCRFDDPFTHLDRTANPQRFYTTNWIDVAAEGWVLGGRLVFRVAETSDEEVIIENEEG
jgi:hypothetical protein